MHPNKTKTKCIYKSIKNKSNEKQSDNLIEHPSKLSQIIMTTHYFVTEIPLDILLDTHKHKF